MGLNRAGRRALERKRGRSAKRVTMGSGAVLALGSSLVGGALPAGAGLGCGDQSSFVVNTAVDEVVCDGVTSLREAAAFANNQAGADTITFALPPGGSTVDVSNTLVGEGNADIDLSGDVTIVGPGITASAAGGPANRIFDTESNSIDVTIVGMTLTGGVAFGNDFNGGPEGNGGAIRANSASLVLDGVTILDNDATNRGGGIFVGGDGELRVTNSTISGNEASYGGGIFVGGYLSPNGASAAAIPDTGGVVIDRSTITGNTASESFGKYNDGTGGGMSVYYTHLIMENSTVSGNTAEADAGGLFLYDVSRGYDAIDTVFESEIRHSTIEGNIVEISVRDQAAQFFTGTGGVLIAGTDTDINLENSIFSGSIFAQQQAPQNAATYGSAPWDVYVDVYFYDNNNYTAYYG
ncbi:MAG: hypothetical protein M3527_00830, partial [Actinomycetota bacterium]|nr:hypothetical protein [Actinomycetota bacterium]